MAKRKKKPPEKIEELACGIQIFSGNDRGLLRPHEVWHAPSRYELPDNPDDALDLAKSLLMLIFERVEFSGSPQEQADKVAHEVIKRFIGGHDYREIDKAFMLTGIAPRYLDIQEKKDRNIPINDEVLRVIPEWQRQLRDRLSEVEIDLLMDAVELLTQLRIGAVELKNQQKLMNENPGLKLTRNEQDGFSRGFRIGRLYERIKSARPMEGFAISGMERHKKTAEVGKQNAKSDDAKLLDAEAYKVSLLKLLRRKPHLGFTDATDEVGSQHNKTGRTIRGYLKLVGINNKTLPRSAE